MANGIGGTSSTNPQVWIIQQFSPTDLAAFPDHQITAINSYIKNDGTITTATAFVMKNGVIDYFEEISADAVEAITPTPGTSLRSSNRTRWNWVTNTPLVFITNTRREDTP